MKYFIALISFFIVAGLATHKEKSTDNILVESLDILLNENTGANVRLDRSPSKKSISFTFDNVFKDFSAKGLSSTESLEFEIKSKDCSFLEEKSIFHCVSNGDEGGATAIQNQKHKLQLARFSSYPLRGEVFDTEKGELKEVIVYQTSFVFRKEGRLISFDFQTLKKKPHGVDILPRFLSSRL